MKTSHKWVGKSPEGLKLFSRKKDAVIDHWQSLVLIEFRFCTAYAVKELNGCLLKTDGTLFPVAIVFTSGTRLIGSSDPYQTGLDYGVDSITFRNALDERNIEQGKKQIAEMTDNEPERKP